MNSEDILSRYKKVIKQIREKMPYYRLSLFCILKSLLSIDLSMDETLSLFPNEISYGMKFRQDICVKEFIDFGNSSYKLDSATVATKMLEMDAALFDNAVDVLAEVIERADKSKDINNNYKQMLNTLVSFRLLRSSLSEIKIDSLLLYYDKIRNTNYCKNNPMFWIQYALAFISAKRIDDAQRCIDSAYGWVKKTHNYDTYQVDTVQAECWLEDLLIHTTEVPTKATLDKWEEATKYILVPQNIHSKDDIAKRFKLVDRYYGILFNNIFMAAEEDMQKRIITLLNSTKSNILQYYSVLSNSKAISVDSLLEKLDNCLNKVPDTFFSLV